MNKEEVVYYDRQRLLRPNEMCSIFRILLQQVMNTDRLNVQAFELNMTKSESLAYCLAGSVKWWLVAYVNACIHQTWYFQETVKALGRYDMFKCKAFFERFEEEWISFLRHLEDSDNYVEQILFFGLLIDKSRKAVHEFAKSENIPSFVDLFDENLKRVNEIWFRLMVRVMDEDIDLETIKEREILSWIEEQVGVQPESSFDRIYSWLGSSFSQITYVYQGEAGKRKRKIVSV